MIWIAFSALRKFEGNSVKLSRLGGGGGGGGGGGAFGQIMQILLLLLFVKTVLF
jgi:hypothetical protein